MNKVRLFDIEFDVVDMRGAVDRVYTLVNQKQFACDYVVTPNIDHIVKLEKDRVFAAAYEDAAIVIADGKPLVLASWILGRSLPETVPGSDLVPAVFDSAVERHQVITAFLFGAGSGVADSAAELIAERWGTHVKVVGTLSPDFGFENDPQVCRQILTQINATHPDVLIIGLGAPKQEIWVHKFQYQLKVGVAFCVGATIDFLAGEKKRAPDWMQMLALEWAYRIYQEPRRLTGRYAYNAWAFPQIFVRQVFTCFKAAPRNGIGFELRKRKSPYIYLACPWGPVGGGMYKVVDYLIQAQNKHGGQPHLKGLDTRGNGSAAESALHLIKALWKVLQGRLSGQLIGVHIHMAERLSVFRKGILLLFSRAMGLPVILHLHAAQLPAFYSSLPRSAKALVRCIVNASNHLIVLGATSQAFAIDTLRVPADKTSIVNNGVPPPGFSKRQKMIAQPMEILFLGNLSERKGVSDLLYALASVSTEHPNILWTLNLAGSGDIEKYECLAMKLRINDRLKFYGWVDQSQAASLLASADTLILPSYDEGLPLVILEALANRTAVICTPVGEIPSILRDGCDALFVHPGDRNDIKRALIKLATEPDYRTFLGEQGNTAYKQLFRIDAFLSRILAIYKQVFKI